jgi:hypothetical protein
MGDARSESSATESSDDTRFASMIRKSLRDVVEAALSRAQGSAESRQDVREAGERLGNALVAYAGVAALPETPRPSRMRTANARRVPVGGGSDGSAQAFRTMAGVRS